MKIYYGLQTNLARIRENAEASGREGIAKLVDDSNALTRTRKDPTCRDDIAYLARVIHNVWLNTKPEEAPQIFINYRQAGEYLSLGGSFGYILKTEVIDFCTDVEPAILRAAGQKPRFL